MKIKYKKQILKAAKEKQQITQKGIPIRVTGDLSKETLQARREWQDILKVMKKKKELKEIRITSETSGTRLKAPTFKS